MTWMGLGRVKRKKKRDSIRNIDIHKTDSTQEEATVVSATQKLPRCSISPLLWHYRQRQQEILHL